MLDNKNIGIIGYKGYIGTSLLYELKNHNCSITKLDLDISKRSEFDKYDFDKFDIIYHLAATEVSKNQSIKEIIKERSVNTDSLLYLSEVINPNTKLIFTSSTNINEKYISTWSSHKLLSENYIKCLFKKWVILRLPNVYGVHCESLNETVLRPVLNRVINYAIKHNSLYLFNNKKCLRDFTHISDITNALFLSAEFWGAYNKTYLIGSKDPKTIEETWGIISKILNINIKYDHTELSEMEMRSYTSDYKNFSIDTNWKPTYDLQTGILDTIKRLKNYD